MEVGCRAMEEWIRVKFPEDVGMKDKRNKERKPTEEEKERVKDAEPRGGPDDSR